MESNSKIGMFASSFRDQFTMSGVKYHAEVDFNSSNRRWCAICKRLDAYILYGTDGAIATTNARFHRQKFAFGSCSGETPARTEQNKCNNNDK